MIDTDAVAPAATTPTLHVTSPVVCVHPGLAEENVTSGGRASVITTPDTFEGPLLCTASVYVSCCPATTGSTLSVFVSCKSATRATFVDASAKLLPRFGSL